MRFLYSGIVNIALLGLSTLNLSAIAATPPTAVTQATTIDRIAIYDSSLTTTRGNGGRVQTTCWIQRWLTV